MKSAPTGRNVAGIVPLTGKQSTFDFPWPEIGETVWDGQLYTEH